jgi:hypothetical protein
MPHTDSALYTAQQAMTGSIAAGLAPAVAWLDATVGGALTPPANKCPKPLRNSINRACQAVAINFQQVTGDAYFRAIGATEWVLYYAVRANGVPEALMIGKPHMNIQNGRQPTPNGNVDDFFAWIPDANQLLALGGQWQSPDDTNVDMAHQGDLIYAHNDKHFGGGANSDALYTIGTVPRRKAIVAGMEEKAIALGFVVAGEAFFKFAQVVGTDGGRPQAPTSCIRVDSAGDTTQHSHPIPENKAQTVSHDGKVKSAIQLYTNDRDLDSLVNLARYLTLIGAARPQYTNLKNDAHVYGHVRPPACAFWRW